MSNTDEINRITAENSGIERDINSLHIQSSNTNSVSQTHTNQSSVNNTSSNSTSRKRNLLCPINSNQIGTIGSDSIDGRSIKKHKSSNMDCDMDEHPKEKDRGIHGKRANFSALGLGSNTNGTNLKLGSSLSKPGDIKKLTIKNFKCKYFIKKYACKYMKFIENI